MLLHFEAEAERMAVNLVFLPLLLSLPKRAKVARKKR